MKHLTILSKRIKQHFHQHKFPIQVETYRAKPQFNPEDVVFVERVLPLQINSEEKRFDAKEITPLAQNGAYVFLLSELMDDFGMKDFGINNPTGLTGIIFKNHAPYAGGRFQFRGYNGIFTRAADFMLGSYLAR